MTNSFGLGSAHWWPPGDEAASEFFEYSATYNQESTIALFNSVTEATQGLISNDVAGKFFAAQIKEKMRTGQPGSYIRLGDADGNSLFSGINEFQALSDYNIAKISRIYFGNDSLMKDHLVEFNSMIVDACRTADAIGGPEYGTVVKSFETPHDRLDVRGMCGMRGVYQSLGRHCDLAELRGAHWTSTWISRSLLPHYFDILHKQPAVGFVTCYDRLPELIGKRCEIGDVITHLIPMQSSIAYQTKKIPHMRKDIGHFPAIYNQVHSEISPPYSGCVYLVAAGILSKGYCKAIRDRGGIAIDIGSVADVWMDFKSRPDMPNEIVDRWSLVKWAKDQIQ